MSRTWPRTGPRRSQTVFKPSLDHWPRDSSIGRSPRLVPHPSTAAVLRGPAMTASIPGKIHATAGDCGRPWATVGDRRRPKRFGRERDKVVRREGVFVHGTGQHASGVLVIPGSRVVCIGADILSPGPIRADGGSVAQKEGCCPRHARLCGQKSKKTGRQGGKSKIMGAK